MAVLIEALSVVIRCKAIAESYEGGVKAFSQEVPNNTLCADGEIAAVNFMTPVDVKKYCHFLESKGLKKEFDGTAFDFVVVDQLSGLCSKCEWALFGKTNWNNETSKTIAVCVGNVGQSAKVVVPQDWIYENSLSSNYRYIDGENIPSSLEFIRKEGSIDVLQDKQTGQEFYVRRS